MHTAMLMALSAQFSDFHLKIPGEPASKVIRISNDEPITRLISGSLMHHGNSGHAKNVKKGYNSLFFPHVCPTYLQCSANPLLHGQLQFSNLIF